MAEHPALAWLVENEPLLAGRNLRWLALSEAGPVDEDEDLLALVRRNGLEGPLYHFVSFAVDQETGRAIPPRPA